MVSDIAILTKLDGDIFFSKDMKIQRTSLLPCKLMKKMELVPGFLNHRGEFLTEEQALVEARVCNQVKSIYFSVKTKLLPIHLKY